MNPNQNQKPGNNQGPMAMPVNAPKSRYSTFFLIMLILASIGAFFSFFGMFSSVFNVVVRFGEGKNLEAALNIASVLVTIASLLSLLLLFMKNKVGFILKITVILLSLIVSVATIAVTKSSLVTEFRNAFDDASQSETLTTEDRQAISEINEFVDKNGENLFLVFGIMFTVLSNSVSLLLWVLAWKSQVKHDRA
jgi:fatty acid desaturase